jgi:thioredoxin-related protein
MEQHQNFTKIDYIASLLVIIIVVIVGGLSARSYIGEFFHSQNPPGVAAEFKDVSWSRNGRTLVFVLSTTCHFCKENAQFHRELAQYCGDHGISTLAVFPQKTMEGISYLKKNHINVDTVRQKPILDLPVEGTPTLLLVDAEGKVRETWVGELTPSGQKSLYTKLEQRRSF